MTYLQNDIINLLKEDSRYSSSKIADMLGVTKSEVDSVIEQLENEGVIVKFTAIVNSDKLLQSNVQALIEVTVTPQKSKGFDAIAQEIVRFPEVESVSLMSGGYDLCVVVNGSDLKQVAMFVSERLSILDTVVSTRTHFILKKYKIEGIVIEPTTENRIAVQP